MASSRPPHRLGLLFCRPRQRLPGLLSAVRSTGALQGSESQVHRARFLRPPSFVEPALITSPKAGLVGSVACLSIQVHEPSHHPQSGSPVQSPHVCSERHAVPAHTPKLHTAQGATSIPGDGPKVSPAWQRPDDSHHPHSGSAVHPSQVSWAHAERGESRASSAIRSASSADTVTGAAAPPLVALASALPRWSWRAGPGDPLPEAHRRAHPERPLFFFFFSPFLPTSSS